MKTYKIYTKKQLENKGFFFMTLSGGAIVADKAGIPFKFQGKTLISVRKEISFYLS